MFECFFDEIECPFRIFGNLIICGDARILLIHSLKCLSTDIAGLAVDDLLKNLSGNIFKSKMLVRKRAVVLENIMFCQLTNNISHIAGNCSALLGGFQRCTILQAQKSFVNFLVGVSNEMDNINRLIENWICSMELNSFHFFPATFSPSTSSASKGSS